VAGRCLFAGLCCVACADADRAYFGVMLAEL
jgi:hypothetical protein